MENFMKKLVLFALLAFAAPLVAVISDAQYEQEVQKELQQGTPAIYLGQEALHHFASKGNLPAVQYLIEVKKMNPYQANPLQDRKIRSPLVEAAAGAHNETVKYLLDHGANKADIQAAKDEVGMVATLSGYTPGTFPETHKETLEILEEYTPTKL